MTGMGSAVLWPPLLFQDGLEFRDGLEILWASSCPLDLDQPLQVQAATLDAEDRDCRGVGKEVLIAAATGDLTKQVEIPDVRRQCEIQPPLYRRDIPPERQPGWRAPQVGMVGRKPE